LSQHFAQSLTLLTVLTLIVFDVFNDFVVLVLLCLILLRNFKQSFMSFIETLKILFSNWSLILKNIFDFELKKDLDVCSPQLILILIFL